MKCALFTGVVAFLVAASLVAASVGRSSGEEPKAPQEQEKENLRVKKLFDTMRDGKYSECEFPKLDASDIPALLSRAESKRTLKTFPRNPASSQYEPTCSEGMVALWLVEGVRRGGKYPSLSALCLRAGVDGKDWTTASENNHRAVARAYAAWWEKAKSETADKLKELDPLKATGLAWH